ncbi:hypothetical protein BGX16_0614 [Hallerella succinigenes]|uniref:Uncharacterized protein n=1 Tax=Hallerella succinigenes TaxID=1896222 RepID=A0A2M9A4W7_9BACT|nr:hypothetical protein BGX16_0614 [Hallerella succinigenes]
MTCRSPLFYVGDKRKLIKEIKTYISVRRKFSKRLDPRIYAV